MVVDGCAKEASILPPVALKGKQKFIKFIKHSLIFLTLIKVERTEFNKWQLMLKMLKMSYKV
jgi:hypothetical protein